MVLGEFTQRLGHSGRYPAVAASPEERNVWSMIEKAVRLLKLVEVGDHFESCPVEILLVSGCAIGRQLKDRKHVHVVDPVTRLGREPIGLRILPLAVSVLFTVCEVLLIFGEDEDLERNNPEDLVIHMSARTNQVCFSPARKQRIKASDQLFLKVFVGGQLRKSQCAIPCADFAVEDGFALMRTR